jgi:hypothetical protein
MAVPGPRRRTTLVALRGGRDLRGLHSGSGRSRRRRLGRRRTLDRGRGRLIANWLGPGVTAAAIVPAAAVLGIGARAAIAAPAAVTVAVPCAMIAAMGQRDAVLAELLSGLEARGLRRAVAVIAVPGGAGDAEHRAAEEGCRGRERANAAPALEQA